VSQVTLSRNRSLGDRVALSRPCGRGSTLRAFPRVRCPAPSQPIVARSVAIPVAIQREGNFRMSTRADDYRQKARAADRRAAQTGDPHVRGAYEQITRDWLALAEQVEWIDKP
jgi:hypothetical protein